MKKIAANLSRIIGLWGEWAAREGLYTESRADTKWCGAKSGLKFVNHRGAQRLELLSSVLPCVFCG